ncbi:CBS domain-containing protein [Dethiothermospora halolimnae]|uniref:CBS domain-containing protein n=1 Tax=Dethiothermospora halolimnae TaxID=3114390 RepID=UPI003CCC1D51
MKAKDIMTKEVITIKENDTVEEVIKIITDNGISGVPVINNNNEVVGIVSESDLIYRDKELGMPAFVSLLGGYIFLESIKKYENKLKKKVAYKVKDLMTTNVITCHEEDDVKEVANTMINKKVNRVPIVNDNNKLAGIISRLDIVKTL